MRHAVEYGRCREAQCYLDAISDGYCYSHAYAALGREVFRGFMAILVLGYAILACLLVAAAVKEWLV